MVNGERVGENIACSWSSAGADYTGKHRDDNVEAIVDGGIDVDVCCLHCGRHQAHPSSTTQN